MAVNPYLNFFLVLGSCLVIVSAIVMIRITARARRLSRRIAGVTFWSALSIQSVDAILTYLFDSYPQEFATVRGSWHLVALGTVAAIALLFWSTFLYLDGALDPEIEECPEH